MTSDGICIAKPPKPRWVFISSDEPVTVLRPSRVRSAFRIDRHYLLIPHALLPINGPNIIMSPRSRIRAVLGTAPPLRGSAQWTCMQVGNGINKTAWTHHRDASTAQAAQPPPFHGEAACEASNTTAARRRIASWGRKARAQSRETSCRDSLGWTRPRDKVSRARLKAVHRSRVYPQVSAPKRIRKRARIRALGGLV